MYSIKPARIPAMTMPHQLFRLQLHQSRDRLSGNSNKNRLALNAKRPMTV